MLHIWHLFTTASCLFLCLTCPYLVTECENHNDGQLNVEQAEVQTNYDNPQHKKFSLTYLNTYRIEEDGTCYFKKNSKADYKRSI